LNGNDTIKTTLVFYDRRFTGNLRRHKLYKNVRYKIRKEHNGEKGSIHDDFEQ